MKLSQALNDWPKKKVTHTQTHIAADADESIGYNTALTSCDREIDRESLAKIVTYGFIHSDSSLKMADHIISTMPTWLKRSEKK